MSDEATTPEGEGTTTTPDEGKAHEETVAYERFQKVNQKAKAETEARKALEKQLADLTSQMEEAKNAGLEPLEQERKRAEALEKRAAEAEKRAEEASKAVLKGQRERWVTSAASSQNFADPSDASAFVNLDDIEDEKDAERAVKRLAAQKKHLLKSEDPQLPGRVLQNGQAASSPKNGGINPSAEAEMLAGELKKYLKSRQTI